MLNAFQSCFQQWVLTCAEAEAFASLCHGEVEKQHQDEANSMASTRTAEHTIVHLGAEA